MTDGRGVTWTEAAERIARTFDVEFSVAMDILYLRDLERRIVAVSHRWRELRDFPVHNETLERFLERQEER